MEHGASPKNGVGRRIGAPSRDLRDQPVAEELPLRPTLRTGASCEFVVAVTTRITEVNRETRDDR